MYLLENAAAPAGHKTRRRNLLKSISLLMAPGEASLQYSKDLSRPGALVRNQKLELN